MIKNTHYTDQEVKNFVRDKIEKIKLNEGEKSLTKWFFHHLLGVVIITYTDNVLVTLNFGDKKERSIIF